MCSCQNANTLRSLRFLSSAHLLDYILSIGTLVSPHLLVVDIESQKAESLLKVVDLLNVQNT